MKKDIKLLKGITKELGFSRSVAIFIKDGSYTLTTYGNSKELCDVSAMDGQKLIKVLEGKPISLEAAKGVADMVMGRDGTLNRLEKAEVLLRYYVDEGYECNNCLDGDDGCQCKEVKEFLKI